MVSGSVLYYGVFFPITTGAKIVAYDLESGDTLWAQGLEGVGPVSHSKYRHFGFIMEFAEDSLLVIRGREAAGDFMEILDRRDGRQLAHKSEREW